MNLPDFIENIALNRLRVSMGASLSKWPVTSIFGRTGPIPDKIVSFTDIEFSPLSGAAHLNGKRVLLHIRDWFRPDDYPKFHLASCKTILDMKTEGRFEKYVLSQPEDGLFTVNRMNAGDLKVLLKVCKNCLLHFGYQGYDEHRNQKSKDIFENFSIKDYFAIYPPDLFSLNPQYDDENAPLNDYAGDWPEISKQLKIRAGYTCEGCGIKLNQILHQRFLHTHHKNGLKYDNSAENLMVLCIYCHAQQSHHSHIKDTPDYNKFLPIRAQLL